MCRRLNGSGEKKKRGRPKNQRRRGIHRKREAKTMHLPKMALKRKTRRRKLYQETCHPGHPTCLPRSALKQAILASNLAWWAFKQASQASKLAWWALAQALEWAMLALIWARWVLIGYLMLT
jgi:hypothetical protein